MIEHFADGQIQLDPMWGIRSLAVADQRGTACGNEATELIIRHFQPVLLNAARTRDWVTPYLEKQ